MKPQDRARYMVHAQSAQFARRVAESRAVLRRAAALGPVAVSTSWGKDSVALADLAIDTLGPVPLVHFASSYELPGSDAVVEHFRARTTVHVEPALRSLDETIAWLREVGLPHDRSVAGQGRVVAAVKKDRGTEWARARGIAVSLLGLRADENQRTRGRLFAARGPLYEARGGWIACPLAAWSAVDVWAWIVARDLPWHPLYDRETHGLTRETLRGGGWLSTDGASHGRLAWLRAHYRAEWERLVAEWPGLRGIS